MDQFYYLCESEITSGLNLTKQNDIDDFLNGNKDKDIKHIFEIMNLNTFIHFESLLVDVILMTSNYNYKLIINLYSNNLNEDLSIENLKIVLPNILFDNFNFEIFNFENSHRKLNLIYK